MAENKLPQALQDKFEIVGTWPKGKFQVVGLEVAFINIGEMTESQANHLLKIGWKGIKAKTKVAASAAKPSSTAETAV